MERIRREKIWKIWRQKGRTWDGVELVNELLTRYNVLRSRFMEDGDSLDCHREDDDEEQAQHVVLNVGWQQTSTFVLSPEKHRKEQACHGKLIIAPLWIAEQFKASGCNVRVPRAKTLRAGCNI